MQTYTLRVSEFFFFSSYHSSHLLSLSVSGRGFGTIVFYCHLDRGLRYNGPVSSISRRGTREYFLFYRVTLAVRLVLALPEAFLKFFFRCIFNTNQNSKNKCAKTGGLCKLSVCTATPPRTWLLYGDSVPLITVLDTSPLSLLGFVVIDR